MRERERDGENEKQGGTRPTGWLERAQAGRTDAHAASGPHIKTNGESFPEEATGWGWVGRLRRAQAWEQLDFMSSLLTPFKLQNPGTANRSTKERQKSDADVNPTNAYDTEGQREWDGEQGRVAHGHRAPSLKTSHA